MDNEPPTAGGLQKQQNQGCQIRTLRLYGKGFVGFRDTDEQQLDTHCVTHLNMHECLTIWVEVSRWVGNWVLGLT